MKELPFLSLISFDKKTGEVLRLGRATLAKSGNYRVKLVGLRAFYVQKGYESALV